MVLRWRASRAELRYNYYYYYYHFLYSHKACFFNQSQCALYLNIVIIFFEGLLTSQKLTTSTASGMENTATFSVTVTPTVKLSPHYTESILPTKAYSTPSRLVSSVSPKIPVSQERQVPSY